MTKADHELPKGYEELPKFLDKVLRGSVTGGQSKTWTYTPEAPIVQGSPEWHEWRRSHVTATDAAIIAGETGSVLELWAIKRGDIEELPRSAEMQELGDEGKAIQPYLIDYHRRKTGLDTIGVDTVIEALDWPVAGCSPDGIVIGEPIGVECKMTSSPRWPAAYKAGEAVPGDVYAQVQWQMRCTEWERVDVVVFLFGRPKVIEVDRDPEYIEDLDALCRTFWRWVETGERPPVDGSETARRVLSQLHPRNDDAGLLPADAEVDALVRGLVSLKGEAARLEDEVATRENALRALIGDADGFVGTWGRVTWRKNRDSVRTNWPAVAAAYRARIMEMVAADHSLTDYGRDKIIEEVKTLESIHSMTVPGPRVLRVQSKGDTNDGD